ncbi:RICIN domain-containing protein [Streptomyces sp. NPDC094049]|uniref:RICIN domain-containing protein n=1 Tax=Streptomyces sp. NPDC094049 TaxID=3154987 RepID=UPI0033187540
MPAQEENGLTGPVVRRAVTMRGTNTEPDAQALRPRSADAETAVPGEEPDFSPEGGAKDGTQPPTRAEASRDMPEPSSAVGGSVPSGVEAASVAEPSSAEETASGETASAEASPGESSSAEGRTDGGAGSFAPVAAEAGGPPGISEGDTGSAGDDPPSGRPTKALLAAAGIGGALLIAVPFLVMGGDYDDKTEPAGMAGQASAQTLQKDTETVRPGTYAPKSPEAVTPSPKTAEPTRTKEAPSPTAPPSSPDPAKGEKPKEQPPKKETKTEPKAPVRGSKPKPPPPPNYSNMKRVLLRNLSTKMCADVPYNDGGQAKGPVNQWYCNGTDQDNQLWDFEVRYKGKGPGSTDLFQIRNRKDGLCMDLGEFDGRPPGTRIAEFYCNGTTDDNQLWWLDSRGGKTFWIRNYASDNQCLEVVSGAGIQPVDAPLDIQPCHSGDDFEWTLW